MIERNYRTQDYGIERQCILCGEWWPDDEEFWHRDSKKKLMPKCKACHNEQIKSCKQRRKWENQEQLSY